MTHKHTPADIVAWLVSEIAPAARWRIDGRDVLITGLSLTQFRQIEMNFVVFKFRETMRFEP